MALRDILIIPDKRLREVSKPVAKIDASIAVALARAGRPTRFEWNYGFIREAIIASPTDKLVRA